MKNLFRRKKKVDIEIIKTESLQKPKQITETPKKTKAAPQPDVSINIVGKQQLREQLSGEEIQAAAEQAAQEIAQLALPEIVQNAQQARQAWRIDEAILSLRQYAHRFGTSSEIEQELVHCLDALEDNTYFQRVTNGQLATILFDAAGFNIVDKTPIKDPHDYLETRLTCTCEGDDLRHTLELMTGSPQRYYCYCLAIFEQPLDIGTLTTIWKNFEARERLVNSTVHFVVCKESNAEANMHINVRRFSQHNVITIPLERAEMRRAIPNDTAAGYLQGKVSTWMDNPDLFATTLPVTRQGEFFGRERDLNQIKNAITKGESFHILGLRRMGKTSLFHHLKSMGAFRSHLYALLDLQSYLDQPNFNRAVEDILRQWFESLQRKHPKIATSIQIQIPGDATPYDQLTAFLDGLRRVADDGQPDIRCLAILDDVNLLSPQNGADALWKRGAGQLVRLLHHRKEIVVTGLTLWDFETRNSIEQEPGLGGKYATIPLGPLEREACDTMITYIGEIINMDFRFDSDTLAAIYRETGGHPLWTRFLCNTISVTRTRHFRYERLNVTPAHIEQAAVEFLSLYKHLLDLSLATLKGAEKRTLRELARSSQPIKATDLSPPPSNDVLTHLKFYGLIEETPTGSGSYRLRMRLLARYLQSQ